MCSDFQILKDVFKTWKLADFGRGKNWLHYPLYKSFVKDSSYFACEVLKMFCGKKFENSMFWTRYLKYDLSKFENTLSVFQILKATFKKWKLADFDRDKN